MVGADNESRTLVARIRYRGDGGELDDDSWIAAIHATGCGTTFGAISRLISDQQAELAGVPPKLTKLSEAKLTNPEPRAAIVDFINLPGRIRDAVTKYAPGPYMPWSTACRKSISRDCNCSDICSGR